MSSLEGVRLDQLEHAVPVIHANVESAHEQPCVAAASSVEGCLP